MKTTVTDVSLFIVERLGKVSSIKLQSLTYYSQAWSMVWDDSPLFEEVIEAEDTGPMCRELSTKVNGTFYITPSVLLPYQGDKLSTPQVETIEAVLDAYGSKSPMWLCYQVRMENPWIHARLNHKMGGPNIITLSSMLEYYSSLAADSCEG